MGFNNCWMELNRFPKIGARAISRFENRLTETIGQRDKFPDTRPERKGRRISENRSKNWANSNWSESSHDQLLLDSSPENDHVSDPLFDLP